MIWETIKVALTALRANKLRSFLTMLGIIIGVGAVITVVAMGEGAQRAVKEQIEQLGTNQLTVQSGHRWWRGVGASGGTFIGVDDYDALLAEAQFASAVVPEMSSQLQIELLNRNVNSSVGRTKNTPAGTANKWCRSRDSNSDDLAGRGS